MRLADRKPGLDLDAGGPELDLEPAVAPAAEFDALAHDAFELSRVAGEQLPHASKAIGNRRREGRIGELCNPALDCKGGHAIHAAELGIAVEQIVHRIA